MIGATMIQPEDLYHTLHCKPFRPFRVHLTDGRRYDICYPHLAVVGKTYFSIGIPKKHHSADPWPLYEYVESVDLIDIDRIESLTAPAQSTN